MADWLTLSQTAGTSGTTTITLTAATNSTNQQRSQGYRVRTSDESVGIIVLQKDTTKSIFVNPSIVYIHSTGTTGVTVITDYAWTATTTDSAVTLSQSTGSGTTNITVGYSDQTHTEITKTAAVVFATDDESATLIVNHTLSGGFFTAYYDVDPDYLTIQLWKNAESYVENNIVYYDVEAISVDDGAWIPLSDNYPAENARYYTFTTSGIHKVDFKMRVPYIPDGFYFNQTQYPWQDPPSQYPVVEVITREGITRIGKPGGNDSAFGVFNDNHTLQKITMGNDIIAIGDGSFENGYETVQDMESHLSSVTFSSNLQEIGGAAFGGCLNLKSVIFPDSLAIIGMMAFYQTGLEHMEFGPNSELTVMGESSFANTCIFGGTGLQSIVIPSGISSLIDAQFVQNYSPNGAPETRNSLETIYAYPIVPPVLYEERPSQTNYHAFDGALAPTGTVYYPVGADYSSWINDSHFTNWTFDAVL